MCRRNERFALPAPARSAAPTTWAQQPRGSTTGSPRAVAAPCRLPASLGRLHSPPLDCGRMSDHFSRRFYVPRVGLLGRRLADDTARAGTLGTPALDPVPWLVRGLG